jgi:hypothetical protein
MNLTKLAIPTLIGLLFATAVIGGWVNQIINLSYRTDGTLFSEYAAKFPEFKNPAPGEASYCDPAYKTRWAGCNLTSAATSAQ